MSPAAWSFASSASRAAITSYRIACCCPWASTTCSSPAAPPRRTRAAGTFEGARRMARMNVKPIAGALGAEITDIDLRRLSDDDVAQIRRVWLEHLVVFFREQELTPAEYMAFAKRIGQPIPYPFVRGMEGFPEIIEVKKLEHEKVNFGGIWHSDTAYLDVPPMASMLLAREVPPRGGDTLFANMCLAYETLSEGMKRLLAPLVAVNTSSK